jgi:two-component system, sensor histidine kinase and response regulator
MKPPIVLCVDDENTVLESLRIELRRSLAGKCLIETAESGDETLQLIADLQQDDYTIAVVIADYIMPGMRGDELLRQIRQRLPHSVNIMLSGQADLDAVGRSIQSASLYRFIAKPWHQDDLRLTIDEALQTHRDRVTIEQQNQEVRRLLKEVQKLNSGLEQQVQERTAQLHHSLEELRELNQLKDDFLHAVSHDLRTPLTGMLLVLRKLYAKTETPICLDRAIIDRMITGCDHQMQMLETILEAHGNERRGLMLNLSAESLSAAVKTVTTHLSVWLETEQATIDDQIAPDLPLVSIDCMQIRRVLENIITNSIKHNGPGIQLTISATVNERFVTCHASDNGVGMPQSECDGMFERYRQGGSRARRSNGIGLGLYISRQIILAHGGEIDAESQPGMGVTISFTLPIAAPNPSHPTPHQSANSTV